MRKEALTQKQIKKLLKDLGSTLTLKEIAEKYKITRRTLFNYRKKYEVLNEPKRLRIRRFLKDNDIKVIIEMRKNGFTFNDICNDFNVNYVTVWRLLKKLRTEKGA